MSERSPEILSLPLTVQDCLRVLCRSVRTADTDDSGASVSTVTDSVIVEAVEYIETHLDQLLSTELIGNALHISRRTLERRFREHLGLSVRQSLMLLRVNAARHMLTTTEQTVTQVAAAIGLASASQLCNVFRRDLNQTPLEVRRSMRRSKQNSNATQNDAPRESPDGGVW